MSQNHEMIHSALHKLFGNHSQFYSQYNLPALPHLKKVFRKKSMEYHPDRAQILGIDEAACTEEFKKLSDAYQLLLPFIRQYKPRFYYSANTAKSRSNQTWNNYHSGPAYKIRFCQFLRRKNIVDFKAVVDALCWQMKHRPRVGDIARKKRIITHTQLCFIFTNRKLGEKTLDAACRLHLINEHGCKTILDEQKKYHFPVGRYFVENGILSEKELTRLLIEFEHTVQPDNN